MPSLLTVIVAPESFWEKYLVPHPKFDLAAATQNRTLPVSILYGHENEIWSDDQLREYVICNPAIPDWFLRDNIDEVLSDGGEVLLLAAHVRVGLIFVFFDMKHDTFPLQNNRNVPFTFIQRELSGHLDWGCLSRNLSVPIELFEQNLDKLNWREISSNPSISEEFYLQHIENLNWFFISCNISAPERLYRMYFQQIDWNSVSMNRGISEEFCEEFYEQLKKYPNSLSANPALSTQFFRKHPELISWEYISLNENIDSNFYREHSDKIHWGFISSNEGIDIAFLRENIEKLEWDQLSINNFGLSPRGIYLA
jgi:hypothetical protein